MFNLRFLASVAAIALLSSSAAGQDSSQSIGTTRVQFQGMTSRGVLTGCTMSYAAVAQDLGYQDGRPVMLKGFVGLMSEKDSLVFALKLGLADRDGGEVAPAFAFVRSQTGDTSSSMLGAIESEKGSRLFAYRLDDGVAKIVKDIIAGGTITIGFKREAMGREVAVPIDLAVADTLVTGSGIERRRSAESAKQFAQCVATLAQTKPRQ